MHPSEFEHVYEWMYVRDALSAWVEQTSPFTIYYQN